MAEPKAPYKTAEILAIPHPSYLACQRCGTWLGSVEYSDGHYYLVMEFENEPVSRIEIIGDAALRCRCGCITVWNGENMVK